MTEINNSEAEIPVSSLINTDSAGIGGPLALNSVFRVVCPQTGYAGTGFLHRGGSVVTAEHVIRNASEIILFSSTGDQINASTLASDADLDIALLSVEAQVSHPALPISDQAEVAIGSQVTTWGFPEGYAGRIPLLSVGYLSGIDVSRLTSGSILQKWVVNAAFNRGNSGGPLLNIETGEVIGVVSSKLAPISQTARSALEALSSQSSGFVYTATLPDGSQRNFSEGQVVAQVLSELRAQVQLVIGKAVMLGDLRRYLESNGIQP